LKHYRTLKKAHMETKRQQKLASLLQETMSNILLREGGNIYGRSMLVSITKVNVIPDISIARFYVSILNAENNDAVVKSLNEHVAVLRKFLGNELRNHFRKIPEIEFFYDDSMEYAEKMEALFRKIKEENKGKEE
jgi:ribosome-binding factor A